MTVRELIEKLNHYNPDAEVLIEYTDECDDIELKFLKRNFFLLSHVKHVFFYQHKIKIN